MRKINEILHDIKDDMSAKLPAILTTYLLPNFDVYALGYPTDQGKAFCCVRFNRREISDGKESFTFTVHLQLPGIDEETSYKYIDAVSEYLNDLETNNYGYYGGSYTIEMLENFRVADNQVFFDYTMADAMDDCG